MIWGKGDSSKLEIEEQKTLAHLRRMVETGHIQDLSIEQGDTLLRALDWYADWEGTFRTLRNVRNVLGLIGFFLVSWWASGGSPLGFISGLFK